MGTGKNTDIPSDILFLYYCQFFLSHSSHVEVRTVRLNFPCSSLTDFQTKPHFEIFKIRWKLLKKFQRQVFLQLLRQYSSTAKGLLLTITAHFLLSAPQHRNMSECRPWEVFVIFNITDHISGLSLFFILLFSEISITRHWFVSHALPALRLSAVGGFSTDSFWIFCHIFFSFQYRLPQQKPLRPPS